VLGFVFPLYDNLNVPLPLIFNLFPFPSPFPTFFGMRSKNSTLFTLFCPIVSSVRRSPSTLSYFFSLLPLLQLVFFSPFNFLFPLRDSRILLEIGIHLQSNLDFMELHSGLQISSASFLSDPPLFRPSLFFPPKDRTYTINPRCRCFDSHHFFMSNSCLKFPCVFGPLATSTSPCAAYMYAPFFTRRRIVTPQAPPVAPTPSECFRSSTYSLKDNQALYDVSELT